MVPEVVCLIDFELTRSVALVADVAVIDEDAVGSFELVAFCRLVGDVDAFDPVGSLGHALQQR